MFAENFGPATHPAILLLNFGGPRNPEEVEPFLYEILSDPNTLQMPFPRFLQNRLARRIARRRSGLVGRQYSLMGGVSPIVEATQAIAKSLAEKLKERERAGRQGAAPPPIYVAHRNLPGWTKAVAGQILADGVDALLALPMYPHFTYTTTGSSLEQAVFELERAGFRGELATLRSYPAAPGYLEALQETLVQTLDAATPPERETVILCSAHGLPASYVKRGDPYREELLATMAGLRERFPQWRFELSFQSKVGPAEWLKPYTNETIPRLAAQGVRHVVFLPISFVNDHFETLFEVGHTYFELVRSQGMTPHRVPAIEAHPAFIALLAEEVENWLAGKGGDPLAPLLPPDQTFAREGQWAWGLWGAALVGVVLFALL